MSNRKKEFMKFLSGVAAMETLVHWAFLLSGVLPLKLMGITLTPMVNAVAMVFWPVATWLLVCYAWFGDASGKDGESGGAS